MRISDWSSDVCSSDLMRRVTDPERIAELDDARAVRLERPEKAAQFHPLDPARDRGISESPWTLADAGSPSRDKPAPMSDPPPPDHPDTRPYLARRDPAHPPRPPPGPPPADPDHPPTPQ